MPGFVHCLVLWNRVRKQFLEVWFRKIVKHRTRKKKQVGYLKIGDIGWRQIAWIQRRKWETMFCNISNKDLDGFQPSVLSVDNIHSLYHDSHVIIDGFLGSDCKEIWDYMGTLPPSSKTITKENSFDAKIHLERFDESIFHSPPWRPLRDKLALLLQELRSLDVHGLDGFGQYNVTVYRENDHFDMHLDDYYHFQDYPDAPRTLNRELTFFYYANPFWKEEEGGRLHLYYWDFDTGQHVCKIVEPRADRVVIFPSKAVLHEVEPFHGQRRITATCWIHNAPEKLAHMVF